MREITVDGEASNDGEATTWERSKRLAECLVAEQPGAPGTPCKMVIRNPTNESRCQNLVLVQVQVQCKRGRDVRFGTED